MNIQNYVGKIQTVKKDSDIFWRTKKDYTSYCKYKWEYYVPVR